MNVTDLKRTFGRHIQGLRETRGLTQEQLADRIGRSVDTVSNIERGINATRLEVAYLISEALEVSLPDLFSFSHAPKSVSDQATARLMSLLKAQDVKTIEKLTDLIRVGLTLSR